MGMKRRDFIKALALGFVAPKIGLDLLQLMSDKEKLDQLPNQGINANMVTDWPHPQLRKFEEFEKCGNDTVTFWSKLDTNRWHCVRINNERRDNGTHVTDYFIDGSLWKVKIHDG